MRLLPSVVVVANNRYAYSTPNERQFACRSLQDRAAGYGVDSLSVDGTELAECLTGFETAVTRARTGHGPIMVVAGLLRLCGHGEYDDASYVDARLKSSPTGRDCLAVAEGWLLGQELASRGELRGWRKEATQSVEEAVAQVQREPGPDPYAEDWCALASKQLSEGV